MKFGSITLNNILDNRFLKKDNLSFWYINTIGWILLIAADSLIVSPQSVLDNWHNFISNTLQWSSGFILTAGLRVIYKNIQYRTKPLLIILVLILTCSLIFSLLIYFSAHIIFAVLNPVDIYEYINRIFSINYIASRMTQIFPIMTSWSLLYFGIKIWLDWLRERDRADKFDLLAQSAQLQMLRYQVNPHFLFNSFSSLRALIRTNQIKAEDMVSKLSEFYRYSLTTKNNTEVPLSEEIEAIEHYFNIEKIRFGNKLEYQLSIDSLAEEYPVPCFIIHPLVENAIKYGMKTSKLPLIIRIDSFVKKNNLIICVSNSGRWLKQGDNKNMHGTNTGLSNIKSRLEYSFPNNHKLNITEEDGSVKIIIEIFKEV